MNKHVHMSRAERRRRARAASKHPRDPLHDGEYGVQPGWFRDLAALDEAKQVTHDTLIASMGDRRTGPVYWRWWDGDEARDVLNQLHRDDGDAAWSDYLRRIAGMLREHGGFLIVAMAEGDKP